MSVYLPAHEKWSGSFRLLTDGSKRQMSLAQRRHRDKTPDNKGPCVVLTCSWMMSDNSFTISLKLVLRPSWYSNWSSLISRSFMSSAMLQAWTKCLRSCRQKQAIRDKEEKKKERSCQLLVTRLGLEKRKRISCWAETKSPENVFEVFHFFVAILVGSAVIQERPGIGHGTCIYLQRNKQSCPFHTFVAFAV